MLKIVNKNNRYILYNVTTDSLVTIYNNGEDINKIIENKEVKEFLYNNLVLVDDNEANRAISMYLINKSKYDDEVLTITDALTYKCNLNCVYCMQQNTFRNVKELSVDERLDEWQRLYEITNSKYVDVYFFGGEPFIEPLRVRRLLEGAKERNINIRDCCAVTNGINISREVVDIINEYQFKHLQITLDGVEDIHNSRRRSVSINSFKTIIDNMHKLIDQTKTNIIVNTVLDKKNLDNYIELVNYMEQEFSDEIYKTDSRLIFNIGEECHPLNKSEYTIQNIATIEEYSTVILSAINYLLDRGIRVNKPIPTPICINKKENDILISPDGDLYKCITGLGVPEFKILTREELFKNPLLYFVRQAKEIEYNIDEGCKKCNYLSLCGGGCKYNAFTDGVTKKCNNIYLRENIEYYIEIMEKINKKHGELIEYEWTKEEGETEWGR